MRNFAVALVTMLAITCFGCTTRSANDAELTAKVKSKLAADSETSALNINVDTNNGVVTLSGTASSEAEKSKAERLAKNTEGVARVVNNVTVKESTTGTNTGARQDGTTEDTMGRDLGDRAKNAANEAGDKAKEASRSAGEALSDATILTKIKSQILAAGIVGTNVDVKDGAVTLKGEVENAQEKSRAEEIARKTDGVKSVKNMLTVSKSGSNNEHKEKRQ